MTSSSAETEENHNSIPTGIPQESQILAVGISQYDDLGREPDRSGSRSGQPDERVIADGSYAFQRDVSGALDGPFIILLKQDGADEPDQRSLIREDADDLGSALDLAIEPFERIGGVEFQAVLAGEVHVGQDVVLRLIEEG